MAATKYQVLGSFYSGESLSTLTCCAPDVGCHKVRRARHELEHQSTRARAREHESTSTRAREHAPTLEHSSTRARAREHEHEHTSTRAITKTRALEYEHEITRARARDHSSTSTRARARTLEHSSIHQHANTRAQARAREHSNTSTRWPGNQCEHGMRNLSDIILMKCVGFHASGWLYVLGMPPRGYLPILATLNPQSTCYEPRPGPTLAPWCAGELPACPEAESTRTDPRPEEKKTMVCKKSTFLHSTMSLPPSCNTWH